MSNDPLMEDFPGTEEDNQPLHKPGNERGSPGGAAKDNWIISTWEGLSRAGLGETVFRVGTSLLSIALVLVAVWGMRSFYLYLQKNAAIQSPQQAALAAEMPTPTPTALPPALPAYTAGKKVSGIYRMALIHTTIPTRPRTEIITYIVERATPSSASPRSSGSSRRRFCGATPIPWEMIPTTCAPDRN